MHILTDGVDKLRDLCDVSGLPSQFSDGYIYAYNAAKDEFVLSPAPAGGASTIAGATDFTDTTGPATDGYSMVWDDATSRFILTQITGGSSTIAGATDFTDTTGAGTDEYTVNWDNDTSRFVLRAPVVDTNTTTIATATDFTDTTGAATDGYRIIWDDATSRFILSPTAEPIIDIPGSAFADTDNPLETEVDTYFGTLSPAKVSGQLAKYTTGEIEFLWEWDGVNAHLINQTIEAFGTSQPTNVDYAASQGDGLIPNNTALLRNNYNFSSFVYDPLALRGTLGSFRHDGSADTKFSDNLISVNPLFPHKLSVSIKVSDNNTKNQYFGLVFYDSDENVIASSNTMFIDGSLATLTRDYTVGDANVYLDNVNGFNFAQTQSFRRGLVFWDYTNSLGFLYLPNTYSRRYIRSLWVVNPTVTDLGGEFEIAANTTGLTRSGIGATETIVAGTQVSQTSSGSTYKYLVNNVSVPADGEWHGYEGWFGGVDGTGTNKAGLFPPGATACKLVFLVNRTGTSANDVQVWFNAPDLRVDTSVNLVEDGTTTTTGPLGVIPFEQGYRPVATDGALASVRVIP